MIIYKKGNIFDHTNAEDYKLHACNAQGKWGPVIAQQFATRYPKSYDEYKTYCENAKMAQLLGSVLITPERVVCLIVSYGYGRYVDAQDLILARTRLAIKALREDLKCEATIHSPRINSGKFAIPWGMTQEIINQEWPGTWIVYDL